MIIATPLSKREQREQQTRSAPSPLVGEGWGGGWCRERNDGATYEGIALPPPPTPPHKGEGSAPCAWRWRLLSKRSFFVPERRVGLGAQRAEHRLGVERQRGEAHPAGVLDGIGDRRRHAKRRGLAHALGPKRAVRLLGVDRFVLHHPRHVEDARNLVVGERGVGHLPRVDVHLLEHGEA